ncbi:MAG: iron-containing alcohol dehydrogenase [Spirochaetaceae bacterium]|nr:iron-containing alcohol dehydrogenase [Spirochaetaceae bacterium]
MPDSFVFRSPTRLVFGPGSLSQIAAEGRAAAPGARKVLVVTGTGHTLRSAGLARLRALLEEAGLAVELFAEATSDPPIELVEACAERIAASGAGFLVAYGGGSPIDCAKAASVHQANAGRGQVGAPHPGAPFRDFLYGKLKLEVPGLPLLAVPTTAGSGSETSAAAVTTDRASSSKRGLSSDFFFPRAAIVDPGLQATMPAELAAATGMDALTHAVESFASLNATPLTRAVAAESAALVARSLERSVRDRSDAAAGADMALGSSIVGMAFSQTGLGMVHGFAHPVGARTGVAHGTANAVLLPYVMEACAETADGPYARLGEVFAAAAEPGVLDPRAPAAEKAAYALDFVRRLSRAIGIPGRLRELGVPREELPGILADAIGYRGRGSSPRAFTDAELGVLLERAY